MKWKEKHMAWKFLKGRQIEKKWIVLGIAVIILLFSHAYGDFYATMRHGITFWTALFDGHPLRFYEYCRGSGAPGYYWGGSMYHGIASCAYDFTIYLIFAIWNFPLWLIERLSGINAQDNLFCMMWGKSLLLAAAVIAGEAIRRIVLHITGKAEESRNAVFIFGSSVLLLWYSIMAGCYDILGLVFILWGIYFYLKDNRKLFVLFFAISFSMKYFGLFAFVPLLLLKEKNILKIIRDLILCCSISVVEKMLFTNHAVSSVSQISGGGMIDRAVASTQSGSISSLGIGNVSAFFICYALLAVWCYVQFEKDSDCFARKAVWSGLAAYMLFFIMNGINSYWIVLIVPFIAMSVFMSEENRILKIMFETLFGIGTAVRLVISQGWIMSGTTCFGMLMWHLFGKPLLGTKQVSGYSFEKVLDYIFSRFGLGVYLNSACFVFMAVMLIITYPAKKQWLSTSFRLNERMAYRIRLFFNLALAATPTFLYCVQVIFYDFLKGLLPS